MNTSASLLSALRQTMLADGIAVWLIPTADPHLSEYLPEHWQTRAAFSGFDGSAGTLAVYADRAELWTDSRYWEQAERQLQDSGIMLKKTGADGSLPNHLAARTANGSTIGVAAEMLSLSEYRSLQTALSAAGIILRCGRDSAGALWTDRPALPASEIYIHPQPFAAPASGKLAQIRAAMHKCCAAHHLISSLDDIAWLTNLRGSDVAYNPVFLSFLSVSETQAVLFTDLSRLPEAAKQQLAEAGISWADYGEWHGHLTQLSGKILIDPDKTAFSTFSALPPDVELIEQTAPGTLLKAVKTAAEAEHIREAMRQDGAALCAFFADFKARLTRGETLTEWDIGTLLSAERARRPHYVSDSFNTIAGFNANGSLPHYAATPETALPIKGDGLLLIDSGGQYLNGTTDITRVIPIGTPSENQKRDFTLVLKAHIALARAVFPENTSGAALDGICRAPLWQAQCDFGHGTGHGVGYFLNVHEGPQSISRRAAPDNIIQAGMLTSNEPGLYRPQQWGIRIENLVLATLADTPSSGNGAADAQTAECAAEQPFGRFLRFETLTLCPIDTRLIVRDMLDNSETEWLNAYHETVRSRLQPLLDGAAKNWLLERTEAL
ncbi:MAG: aminopeptidase P family protein [Neisseria sp.]|nr:aminopeptidase P family protein [Neisseria sp.]